MATPKTKPISVTFDPPLIDDDSAPSILDEKDMTDFERVAPSVAPPKPRSATRAVGKRASVENELDRLRDELQRNVSFVGLMMCAKDPWLGQLILLNRDRVIDQWIDVCRINPTIRNALLSIMDMGVYATAIVTTLSIAIAALAHMKIIPNGDMIVSGIAGTGVTIPTDAQVQSTEAMFDFAKMFAENADMDSPNPNGNVSE